MDWDTIYDGSCGRLEWLEYNVKRSLGIECSREEVEVGISEVKNTIKHIVYYHDAKSNIINSLENVSRNF